MKKVPKLPKRIKTNEQFQEWIAKQLTKEFNKRLKKLIKDYYHPKPVRKFKGQFDGFWMMIEGQDNMPEAIPEKKQEAEKAYQTFITEKDVYGQEPKQL